LWAAGQSSTARWSPVSPPQVPHGDSGKVWLVCRELLVLEWPKGEVGSRGHGRRVVKHVGGVQLQRSSAPANPSQERKRGSRAPIAAVRWGSCPAPAAAKVVAPRHSSTWRGGLVLRGTAVGASGPEPKGPLEEDARSVLPRRATLLMSCIPLYRQSSGGDTPKLHWTV